MKKILVLGSGGMLGHIVCNYLESLDKYEVLNSSHSKRLNDRSYKLDVTDKHALKDYILTEKPDVLVNCVGVLIKGAKDNPENAIYINSYLPHYLNKLLDSFGGKLVHISTDCVFNGSKGPYSESDICDALDIYGKSKALGEVRMNNAVVLRTSIIGPEIKSNGEGLFHWFMGKSGIIGGYVDAFWGGVTTLELAKVILHVIDSNIEGLIHVTNGKPISKYELLSNFKEIWRVSDMEIRESRKGKINKSLVCTRNDFEYVIPTYLEMLEELRSWMNSKVDFYANYER